MNIPDLIPDKLTDSFRSVSEWDSSVTGASTILERRFIKSMNRRGCIYAFLVICLGTAASAGFLYIGISSAKQEEVDQFNRMSKEVISNIHDAWRDYEEKALWIHEACRDRTITRQKFSELYYHLNSVGSEFQAAEFIPNVTHDERLDMENESKQFYAENYPHINYTGFKGLEPINGTNTLVVQERSKQQFYFPVYYVEPVVGNEAAIEFDLYSSASRRAAIDLALDTWKPALSPRLRLVQETEKSTYSVILFHPGISIPVLSDLTPKDVSSMVIQIPALMNHALRFQAVSASVYLFDTSKEVDSADFLGGIEVKVDNENKKRSGMNSLASSREIELSDLHRVTAASLIYEEQFQIASRNWTIVVHHDKKSGSGSTFVIACAVLMEIASMCIAWWAFCHHTRRMETIKSMQQQAETEKAIVKSLYPSGFRSRVILDRQGSDGKSNATKEGQPHVDPATGLTLTKKLSSEKLFGSEPIADFFPETTIMFADLVGFTAWSSNREPTEVFTLLEVIYHAFDTNARRSRVFKVETIGDCYVAVTGLPRPRKDHARAMARFARDCQLDLYNTVQDLQNTLGPDTVKLDIRIGLHSGPVTAGVLRGDKGRFQLFGDTMNTASRMESTGLPSKIQASQETADQLKATGKGHWLRQRDEKIVAKGKGELQTYWLEIGDDVDSDMDIGFAEKNVGDVDHSVSGRNQQDTDVEHNNTINTSGCSSESEFVAWTSNISQPCNSSVF